jgi:hypothetical protein
MKSIRSASIAIVAATSVFSTVALAAMPQEAADIRTGSDLTAACIALVERDVSDEGAAASKACSGFLGAMVQKVYEATEAGAPTVFNRIGPKQDEVLCFKLEGKLSFVDFAKLVVTYGKSHPALDDRPAYETGAYVLSNNYPCPKTDVAP